MQRNEIKLEIKDVQKFINRLRIKGAVHLGDTMEKTYRYDTPNLDLEKKGVFLRLRSGFSNTLTVKKKLSNSNENYRIRDDVTLEIDNINKAREMLKTLGYTYERIMEKYRVEWQYKRTKITIDELPFGIYSEIVGEQDQIKTVCKELGLDFSSGITETYWGIYKEISSDQNILFPQNYRLKLL